MLSYRSLARRAAIFVLGHVVALGLVGVLAMTASSADTQPLMATSGTVQMLGDQAPATELATGSLRLR